MLKFTYSSGHDAELRIQRSGLEAERQSAQKAKDDAAKALAAAAEKLMVSEPGVSIV